MDVDLLRVWQLVRDLSSQLVRHKLLTTNAQLVATLVGTKAVSARSGYNLRRYNTDISKEVFESELERNNAQIIIENQTLLHENKQLSALLKEYETTMETVMSKFRNHALAAQQHEMTLMRHYEALLLARETQSMSTDLTASANAAQSLQRLSRHIHALLCSLNGQEPEPENNEQEFDPEAFKAVLQRLDEEIDAQSRDDWALEREEEITRLEKENEELRKQLGIDEESVAASGIQIEERLLIGSMRHAGLMSSRRRSGSSGGVGSGAGNDAWGQRPQSTTYVFGPGGNPNGSQPQQQQQQQQQQPPQQQQPQQQQASFGGQLQRPVDLQTTHQGGTRLQGRRPAMFGQRGGISRGGTPSTSLWSGAPPQPVLQLSDRPWQTQGSSIHDFVNLLTSRDE